MAANATHGRWTLQGAKFICYLFALWTVDDTKNFFNIHFQLSANYFNIFQYPQPVSFWRMVGVNMFRNKSNPLHHHSTGGSVKFFFCQLLDTALLISAMLPLRKGQALHGIHSGFLTCKKFTNPKKKDTFPLNINNVEISFPGRVQKNLMVERVVDLGLKKHQQWNKSSHRVSQRIVRCHIISYLDSGFPKLSRGYGANLQPRAQFKSQKHIGSSRVD